MHKELRLIDRQSMAELVHSFAEVAKAADVVFAGFQSHWYTMGIGAAGAKHALKDFQMHYESLLTQGKDKEASDLLRGTRETAERTLELQKQVKAFDQDAHTHYAVANVSPEAVAATKELKKAGVGYSKEEVLAYRRS